MATEKLKFRLELYSTMWDKPPHVEILIGKTSFFNGDVISNEGRPLVCEFEVEVQEHQTQSLVIKRSGKSNNQTVLNEKGDILKDQLLHIKSIEIDDINIGALIYDGVYTPSYPEPWASQQRKAGHDLPASFKNVTKMGHNGTWTFKFSSPFYMWLLENLY